MLVEKTRHIHLCHTWISLVGMEENNTIPIGSNGSDLFLPHLTGFLYGTCMGGYTISNGSDGIGFLFSEVPEPEKT